MRPPHQVALVAALLAAPAFLPAQTQPDEAENRQDEVVTVHLAPDASADGILRILRAGDKFEANQYETRAFELFNSAATEMIAYVEDMVDTEKGEVRGAKTKPTDGSASRQFLVVTTTPAQMPSIEEAIRALDVDGLVNSSGTTRVAVRMRHRLASDLSEVLSNTRGTGQTDFYADDQTNTLYFDDSPYVAEAIEPYLEFYDVPSPQIEFDVRIIEVREDDASRLGVDWDAWKNSLGGQASLSASRFEGGADFVRLDTLLTLDASVLADFLSYTVTTGSARLLQRSRLNASNLEPAVISDARRVSFASYERTTRDPVVVTEDNPGVDAYGEPGRGEAEGPRVATIVPPVHNQLVDLSAEEEGLAIAIQPVIGTETVSAAIDIEMNTVSGFDRLDRPILTEQHLSNIFTLEDGERILLGTLERDTVTTSTRGIPVLKDLPVLGAVFGVEVESATRSRLFILATPRFSNTRFEAQRVSDLKDGRPTLRRTDRPVVLDDGAMDEAINELP